MIDETSLKILKILQDKARIPNVEVARQVGLAPSAVLERIRKLENQGIIDGYEVRLNPKQFLKSLIAFITVKSDAEADIEEIGRKLALLPEVQEVHHMAGEDGCLVKVRVLDPETLVPPIGCLRAGQAPLRRWLPSASVLAFAFRLFPGRPIWRSLH